MLVNALGRAIALTIAMSASIRPVLAAGIALREGSTDWMANAFAGETAKAYDASTAFSNPAGMTRLDWNETDLSVNLVAPSTSFSGSNTIGGQPHRDPRAVIRLSRLSCRAYSGCGTVRAT